MTRKSNAFLLIAALLLCTGAVLAQTFAFGWNPRSGDPWMDGRLADINQYGQRYPDPFVDEITRYYGAPRALVSELLIRRHWAPGDIYFACALAQVAGQPCRVVVDAWDRDHAQGWGAIAKRMGIAPGSEQFHRLKRGVVPTYDRWSRPIMIDDSLRADFPQRAPRADTGGGQKAKTPAVDSARGQRGHDKHDSSRSNHGKPDQDKSDHGKPGRDKRGHDKPQHGKH
jgi:hypothetical protein